MRAQPAATALLWSPCLLQLRARAGSERAGWERAPRSLDRRRTFAAAALLATVVALDALGGSPAGRTLHSLVPLDAASPPPLATLLHADSPSHRRGSTPATLDAFLVTSPRDCASNLDALDLLAREDVAPRVRLAAALVAIPRQQRAAHATVNDTAAIRTVREAIAAHGLPIPPVRALDPATAQLLRQMGYRTTPLLVVLDSAGTLRFATPPARSFAEFHGLARALAALAATPR
ncbi:MAG TPA: hypothetical protein VFJ74_13675 [Gemmatimonadaceae bacterium]|nr:hypothetical protein [Gemmatimonadaceae bacterium]